MIQKSEREKNKNKENYLQVIYVRRVLSPADGKAGADEGSPRRTAHTIDRIIAMMQV